MTAVGAGTAAGSPLRAPAGTQWVVGLETGGASALLADLRHKGAGVRPLARLRAVTVTGGDRAGLIAALREHQGLVAYLEPARERHLLAEPAEATDPQTGRPYAWAQFAVGARAAIAAADGGAPGVPVAVVDSGVDASHPDLAGRVLAGRSVGGGDQHTDEAGHGTFVAGLIGATDGNGIGGFGVAGQTPLIPVKVSDSGVVSSVDLAAGIVAGVDAGAKVINVSIGGPQLAAVEQSALNYAAAHEVLVVASAGNGGDDGNPIEYPAAALGGPDGGWGTGLSVAASRPSGAAASFSTHNRFVSLAAPGAGAGPCTEGVHSTVPQSALLWSGGPCDRTFITHGLGRYAYGEGTSFSAPLVAGAAALVRQVRPQLSAAQTADVITRSAHQTVGAGWNEYTGAGVLDMPAAIELASRYDLTAPVLSFSVSEGRGAAQVRASADDRSVSGQELAGGVSLELSYSRDGDAYVPLAAAGLGPFDQAYAVSVGQPLWFRARACDRNRNCVNQTAGPFTGAGPGTVAGLRSLEFLRVSVLSLGIRKCRAASRGCLRLAWKVSPAGAGTVRYSISVGRIGAAGLLLRRAGHASAGRRVVVDLPLRRGLVCGRLLTRIRVSHAAASDATRRYLTLPACQRAVR